MKNKSIFALFVILLLISINGYSQENYKPGFIITNTNDTINGYILSVNTNQNKKCSFKKSLTDKAILYLPDQLFGYRFDGKFYISKDTPEGKSIKRYFLEYMIQGKANIYLRVDKTGENYNHYYIETDRFKIVELTETTKYLKNEDGELIVRPTLYTGKLKYILSDCPEIYSEIDHLKLYPTQLIKLAEDYHNHVCTGEKCIIYEKKIQPVKINWGFIAGTSYNKFYFEGSNTDYRFNGFIGLNLEVENVLFSLEQLSLKTGLNLQQFNKYNFFDNIYNLSTGQMNFQSYSLMNPITLNYSFPLNRFIPYIGAGISNTFVISQNNLNVNVFNSGHVLPTYQFGYEGAVGLKYKMTNHHYLNFEFNYVYEMNTDYYSMQLGYFF